MRCDAARTLMHGYLDGELEPAVQADLRAHLAACPLCVCQLEETKALRAALGNEALRYQAPAALRDRIRTEIFHRRAPREFWKPLLPGMAVAASWAVVALVSWNLAPRSFGPSPPSLSQEVVANHVRALMVDHAIDVASSDRHTVRPWFTGKLGFSPRVPDLSKHGFTLVGGRLDYLGGKPVAALVYKRRRHVINLFVGPATAAPQSAGHRSLASGQGYHVVHWQGDDANYWAVSDLNPGELREFSRLFGIGSG